MSCLYELFQKECRQNKHVFTREFLTSNLSLEVINVRVIYEFPVLYTLNQPQKKFSQPAIMLVITGDVSICE